MNVSIIGTGGVGSNVAMVLSRLSFKISGGLKLTLFDEDIVEYKNIERQFFFIDQVGMKKVDALKQNIQKINPDIIVDSYHMFIKTEQDLEMIPKDSLVVVGTDSVKNKVMVCDYLDDHNIKFILYNCEKNVFEVKTKVDGDERNCFEFGTGYASTQDIISNLLSVIISLDFINSNPDKISGVTGLYQNGFWSLKPIDVKEESKNE